MSETTALVTRIAVAGALALALASCTDPGPLDPTGTWHLTVTWGAGDCGATGTEPIVRVVSGSLAGYTITGAPAGNVIQGSLLCDERSCTLQYREIETTADYQGTVDAVWILDEDDSIIGNGRTTVTFSGGSCSQAWISTGRRL